MALNHLEDVHAIEQESFSVPWSKKELQSELTNNRLAVYLVALNENSDVMGYAGMWHVVNEGHITNIAVKREFRGQGVGSRLLESIIEIAGQKEMIGITLEVRISNMKAQSLYTKYGFKPEGFRKRYYSDTNEDAIIMWKHF
ncbi:MAG: ribosomal protein S18-alanine N-acetyltransferase [Clostridiales bacterium]|jgi:ribosomal-protein-alanine N-acetyltransferase|nr:ribosomal protein S18-alanine N-acetyltransferase [Clostridiales bacterium]